MAALRFARAVGVTLLAMTSTTGLTACFTVPGPGAPSGVQLEIGADHRGQGSRSCTATPCGTRT